MRALLVATSLFSLLSTASPLPAPNPEPLTAASFASFPVNVIMTAGAAQFGTWVSANGLWYSTATLTCLNAGANSYGACSTPSFDRVGVVAGNGPCTFVGSNGFWRTVQGDAGDGFVSVAPPQQISLIVCG